MTTYVAAQGLHYGDAYEVYDVDGTAVVIVRRVDGAEKLVQGDDGLQLERELDLFGEVFDSTAEYVQHTDGMLANYFGDGE